MTGEQAPHALPVNPAGIPDELKARPQWVVWRYDPPDEPGKKWRKRPYNARTGSLAKPNDRQTWATYETALAAYEHGGWAGVGFVFSSDDPYCGIDIDGCRDPESGAIDPHSRRTIDELNSYAECSASGTGVHVIVQATRRGDRSRTGAYELYDAGRYFTFTGHRLDGSPAGIEARQAETDALCARLFTEPDTTGAPPRAPHTMRAPIEMLTDDGILQKLRTARNAAKFTHLWAGETGGHGGDHSAADMALAMMLAFYTDDAAQIDRLFRRSGLYRPKWDERHYSSGETYGQRTISEASGNVTDRWQTGAAASMSTPGEREGSNGALSASRATSPAPRIAIVRSLADVESKALDWLWPRWLPARMLGLLGGYPGDGKSTLLAWLIAIFSRGGWLPDGSRAPQFNTLLLAAEDDPEYAIRPRLDRHQADLNRIVLLEGTQQESGERKWFDLQRDCDVMRDVIEARAIRLVVIDPLSSYLSKSDRNSEGDVRDALAPLLKLMQETGVAVIGVMHVGKATGRRPMQLLMGSTAFPAIARTAWMVHDLPKEHQDTPTDDEPNPAKKKVLGVVKSNYSLPPKPLAFSIPLDGAVKFHGESPVSLEEAFAGEGAGSKKGDAEEWLADYLKGGSRLAREVEQAAKDAGHSEATLRRARVALKVETKKGREPNAPWYWSLPSGISSRPQVSTYHNESATKAIEDAQVNTLNTFPESPDILPRGAEPDAQPASVEESKMLKTPYIDNLSAFDSGTALTPADECCEPGCRNPIAPGNRYLCAQHRPGAA